MKKWLVVSGILIASMVAALFVANRTGYIGAQDERGLGPLLAQVREVKGEFRYKHPTSFFWSDARVGQNLFNRSQVHTGPSGEAQLILNKNNVLQVPPNTLLTLSADANNLQNLSFNLDQGSFKIENLNPQLQITLIMGGKTISVQSASSGGFFAKKSVNGEIALAAISGEITLQSGSRTKKLLEGEAVSVKPPEAESSTGTAVDAGSSAGSGVSASSGASGSGDVAAGGSSVSSGLAWNDLERPKLELVFPPNRYAYYDDRPEFFKWKAPQDLKVMLQLSSQQDFKSDLQQDDVTGVSEFIIPKTNKGIVYWRLATEIEGVPLYSSARSFGFAKMVSEQSGDPTLIFKSRGKWQLVVTAKGAKPTDRFNFQVSQKPDFESLYDAFEGASPMTALIDQPGNYYIRQRKFFGGGMYSDWSPVVSKFVRPPLEPVSLTTFSQNITTAEQNQISIDWKPTEFATSYIIQVGEGSGFGKILKSVAVERPPFDLPYTDNKPGVLRVLARSIEGEISPPSNSYEVKGVVRGPFVEVKEALPRLFEKPQSSPQLHLLWRQREGIAKYRVEVGRSPDLHDGRMVETPNIEFFYDISEEGWYYFRVWSVADVNRYFVIPTPIFAVKYGLPGPLLTSKIISPKNKEVFLTPKGVQVSIKFNWTESPESQWYTLQLAQTRDFKNARDIRVAKQELILNERLSNGQWYFRVRGMNKYQASEWSETGVFYFGVSQ